MDINESAHRLLSQHGECAGLFAAIEADACMDALDLNGWATWMAVIRVIRELLDAAPPEDSIAF